MKTKAIISVKPVNKNKFVLDSHYVKSEFHKKIDSHLSVIQKQNHRLTLKPSDNSSEFQKCNIKTEASSSVIGEHLTSAELLQYIDGAMMLQQNAYEAALTTNRVYSVQMLLIFLESFISFTFNWYYMFCVIVEPSAFKLPQAESITYLAQHLIQPVICVLVIVIGFSMVKSRFVETQKIVNKLIIYSKDYEIRRRFLDFSQQIHTNDPGFNIFGFFLLDGSVIFSIISATTTYLIILIQTLDERDEYIQQPTTALNKTG